MKRASARANRGSLREYGSSRMQPISNSNHID